MSFDPKWVELALKAIASVPVTANILTPVTVNTTSAVIAPANPNRVGFVIYNNSSNSRYVCLGATATGTLCHKIIATFATWECYGPVCYTGILSAIGNAGTGTMNVVELVRAP